MLAQDWLRGEEGGIALRFHGRRGRMLASSPGAAPGGAARGGGGEGGQGHHAATMRRPALGGYRVGRRIRVERLVDVVAESGRPCKQGNGPAQVVERGVVLADDHPSFEQVPALFDRVEERAAGGEVVQDNVRAVARRPVFADEPLGLLGAVDRVPVDDYGDLASLGSQLLELVYERVRVGPGVLTEQLPPVLAEGAVDGRRLVGPCGRPPSCRTLCTGCGRACRRATSTFSRCACRAR